MKQSLFVDENGEVKVPIWNLFWSLRGSAVYQNFTGNATDVYLMYNTLDIDVYEKLITDGHKTVIYGYLYKFDVEIAGYAQQHGKLDLFIYNSDYLII